MNIIHYKTKINLLERIGWMLMRRTVKAKKTEGLFAASKTSLLEEKIKAISY